MLCNSNSTSTSTTSSSAAPHGHGDDVNEVQVQKYCEEEEKIVSSFESEGVRQPAVMMYS
jgi:hypothetical protein